MAETSDSGKVVTHVVEDWPEFLGAVRGDRAESLWRGQGDSRWPLTSTLERLTISAFGEPLDGNWQSYRQRLDTKKAQAVQEFFGQHGLGTFQNLASGCRGPHPTPLAPDQWEALGRHYGLLTRFLDWSLKPFVAAFFALQDFESHGRRGPGPAVFRLRTTEAVLRKCGIYIVPLLIDELPRLHNQHSVFTRLSSPKFLEIEGAIEAAGSGQMLEKFVFTPSAAAAGLEDLALFGVTWRTMYPDLEGAAKEANAKLANAILRYVIGLGS